MCIVVYVMYIDRLVVKGPHYLSTKKILIFTPLTPHINVTKKSRNYMKESEILLLKRYPPSILWCYSNVPLKRNIFLVCTSVFERESSNSISFSYQHLIWKLLTSFPIIELLIWYCLSNQMFSKISFYKTQVSMFLRKFLECVSFWLHSTVHIFLVNEERLWNPFVKFLETTCHEYAKCIFVSIYTS